MLVHNIIQRSSVDNELYYTSVIKYSIKIFYDTVVGVTWTYVA